MVSHTKILPALVEADSNALIIQEIVLFKGFVRKTLCFQVMRFANQQVTLLQEQLVRPVRIITLTIHMYVAAVVFVTIPHHIAIPPVY